MPIGDAQYDDGELTNFNSVYNPSWGRVKDITKPVVGNHEYNTAGAGGYYTYFGSAASPLDASCTFSCKGYYSYDMGSWHIIVLNSEIAHGTGSAQELWLKNDLASHTNACVLAAWHRPLFTSFDAASDPSVLPFWRDLYEAGAEVILNGHVHFYERFARQRPDGSVDSATGIRQFVVGTGGKSLSGATTVAANSEVRNSSVNGVIKMTLHDGSYDWTFRARSGQTFNESGSEPCHGMPTTSSGSGGVSSTISGTGLSTNSGTTATSLGLAVPAGASAGNVAVASVAFGGGSGTTITSPAGWTLDMRQNNGIDHGLAVYHKVIKSGDLSTTASWLISPGKNAAGAMRTYNGVDTTAPLDVSSAGQTNSTASTSITAPSVTTASANAEVLTFHGQKLPLAKPSGIFTPPAGQTEVADVASQQDGTAPYNVALEVTESQQTAAGATGAKAATSTQSATSVGITLALRPAAPSAPAVTIKGTGKAAVSGVFRTTLSAAIPGTASAGDLALASYQWGGGTAVTATPPAGWTLIRRQDDGTNAGMALYYRLLTASDLGTSPTFTTSLSKNQTLVLRTYSGVNATPVDVSGSQANTTASTDVRAPSVTTTHDADLLIMVGGQKVGAATPSAVWTAPAGMDKITEASSQQAGTGVFNMTQGFFEQSLGTAAASGTRTATSIYSFNSVGFTVALMPQ
jgi:hypothetical protein